MQKEMLAAVLHGPKDLRVEKIEIPKIGDNEVLIKVKCCGVCGTDPHIYNGRFPAPFPLVLGHEFSGEVVEVGKSVKNTKVGDKVTADINIACGSCYYCNMGQKLFCEDIVQLGVHVNGAFAEYIKAPAVNVYKLPDSMTWEEGAYVEPLACVINGQERIDMKLGSTVVIIGAGPMGLAHALLSKQNGASKVIITELNAVRLQKARDLGIDYVIDASKENAVEKVKELTEGRGADYVIEAVGSVPTYKQGLEMVRKGGTMLFYGAAPADAELSIKPFEIYAKELKLIGSYAGTYDRWTKAINMIANNRFIPSDIISNKMPLEKIKEAILEADTNKDGLKIMVTVD